MMNEGILQKRGNESKILRLHVESDRANQILGISPHIKNGNTKMRVTVWQVMNSYDGYLIIEYTEDD